MLDTIISMRFEITAVVLFGIGLATLFLNPNLIKKIIGMNIMDSSVCLLLAASGYVDGRKAPIIVDGVTDAAAYINPVPGGLVLTGIVVAVSTTAVFLALTQRLYQRYHTLNLDDIMIKAKKGVK